MAKSQMDVIEEEVRELILNSKFKRTTILEPCNKENISECLKSIQEELTLYGINYMYNPHLNMGETDNLWDTLIRLINATWNLLRQHKEIHNNVTRIKDQNYSLQQNNVYMNNLTDKLNNELQVSKNKQKEIQETNRQMIYKIEMCKKDMAKISEELKKTKKQLISREETLLKQINKMKKDFLELQDKARKSCGIFMSKSEADYLHNEDFKLKEKNYKETIAKLQEANRNLVFEVINLKEDIMQLKE